MSKKHKASKPAKPSAPVGPMAPVQRGNPQIGQKRKAQVRTEKIGAYFGNL